MGWTENFEISKKSYCSLCEKANGIQENLWNWLKTGRIENYPAKQLEFRHISITIVRIKFVKDKNPIEFKESIDLTQTVDILHFPEKKKT